MFWFSSKAKISEELALIFVQPYHSQSSSITVFSSTMKVSLKDILNFSFYMSDILIISKNNTRKRFLNLIHANISSIHGDLNLLFLFSFRTELLWYIIALTDLTTSSLPDAVYLQVCIFHSYIISPLQDHYFISFLQWHYV